MTVTTLPTRGTGLAGLLAAHGDRPALHGPEGTMTYAALAGRVEEVARAYAGARRLVLLTPANDVGSVVEYLGAVAADQVVLLCGPAARGALVAAYDPDVVADGAGREWRRGGADRGTAHDLHPDLALLLTTSGSTGSPKLVRLGRAGVLANARAIVESLGIRSDDVAATTLPLHYCYGLSVLHSHLLQGGSLLLTDASVTDECFWRDARAAGVTTFPGVPHTYELLERSGFAERDLPSLRYVTQAGGRLAPDKVRDWVALGRRKGFDLVVMYGQTEATARLAVLPADLAEDAPEAIGLPVPGVELSLAPTDHPDPEVGELVARGDNVMLGYAETPADLARGRTVEALHTGDLARRRPDGLWQVVGRRSRFAKVWGLRLDLDHVERLLAGDGYVVAAADAGDRVVLGVAGGARPVDADAVRAAATRATGLAPAGVEVVVVPDLPRLPNGKVDHPALVALTSDRPGAQGCAGAATAAEVTALLARLLGRPDARPTDSFVALGGDSMSYVEVSIRLERLLGHLPAGWPTMPAAALADAPAAPPRCGALVETNVLLRALAIVTIVGSHANVMTLLGGAHLLLAVAGFNLARFQLTDVARRERVGRLVRAAGRIALPSVAVIGAFSVVGLWAEGLTWRQVLLVNGLTSASWSEPGWYFWFVEAMVHTLLLLAVLLAVPRVDALERARPFAFPMALVAVAMLSRYDVVNVPGDGDHRAHVAFWLFALGWAAARARSRRERLLVSAVAVATLAGAFEQAHRDAYVALGLLALVWVPQVRVPRWAGRVAGLLAGASLWTYLTHWQVYPRWEDSAPLLALALSLVVGVACWAAYEGVGRWLRGWLQARNARTKGGTTSASRGMLGNL